MTDRGQLLIISDSQLMLASYSEALRLHPSADWQQDAGHATPQTLKLYD